MNTALNDSRTVASGWVDGDHRRVHPHRDLAVERLDDGEQLHDVAEPAGEGDVGRGDRRDALAVDVARDDAHAEGDAGDDRRLGGGVEALDVGGGVALGVAQGLRLGQGVVVGRAAARSCG